MQNKDQKQQGAPVIIEALLAGEHVEIEREEIERELDAVVERQRDFEPGSDDAERLREVETQLHLMSIEQLLGYPLPLPQEYRELLADFLRSRRWAQRHQHRADVADLNEAVAALERILTHYRFSETAAEFRVAVFFDTAKSYLKRYELLASPDDLTNSISWLDELIACVQRDSKVYRKAVKLLRKALLKRLPQIMESFFTKVTVDSLIDEEFSTMHEDRTVDEALDEPGDTLVVLNEGSRPVGIVWQQTLRQLLPSARISVYRRLFIVPTITNPDVSLDKLFQQVVRWSSIPWYVVMDGGWVKGVVLAPALSAKLGEVLGIPRIFQLAEAGAVVTDLYGDMFEEPPICYRCEQHEGHCLYADQVEERRGGDVYCRHDQCVMIAENPCQKECRDDG